MYSIPLPAFKSPIQKIYKNVGKVINFEIVLKKIYQLIPDINAGNDLLTTILMTMLFVSSIIIDKYRSLVYLSLIPQQHTYESSFYYHFPIPFCVA